MRKAGAPFISAIALKRDSVPSFKEYPFSIPAIRNLRELRIPSPVTFLVGENGTGKSTLLEGVAVASGFNAEGGSRNFSFFTRPSHSGLHEYLRLVRSPGRPRDGYFLPPRASTTWRPRPRTSMGCWTRTAGARCTSSPTGSPSWPCSAPFRGEGAYISSIEPEAALSPTRQISLLAAMHGLVRAGLPVSHRDALPDTPRGPGRHHLSLHGQRDRPRAVQETEHYVITKHFLNDPERMLRELLSDPSDDGSAGE